ncbi:MAG TPA: exodeoxyribonuclease VII small subunit [Solimonas sp.]|nr:exodeoxyribonuclease VII small subunit [Solimonas sp.]
MPKKPEPADADPVGRFEEALRELEGIVQNLERGDLRLDDSLKLFERGVLLTRQCRQSLDSAELKLRNLLDPAAGDAAP